MTVLRHYLICSYFSDQPNKIAVHVPISKEKQLHLMAVMNSIIPFSFFFFHIQVFKKELQKWFYW